MSCTVPHTRIFYHRPRILLSNAPHTRLPQAGFTLLEIMVVVLIMGLIAGLVSVIVQPDDRGLLDVESRRLAQLLDLASAEARVSGTSLAWIAEASGYRFEQLSSAQGWHEITHNNFLRARDLPANMTVSALLLENNPLNAPWRVEFPAYGQTTAFTVTLANGTAFSNISVSPVGMVTVDVFAGEDADGR
ncbi:MAG: GspH/FimT family pseudopilin [Pseudohongiella sp.]|nr:GspH/FimT family pseudopilin [Pseudohongiella sp.]